VGHQLGQQLEVLLSGLLDHRDVLRGVCFHFRLLPQVIITCLVAISSS
jgi:hypothetical protein